MIEFSLKKNVKLRFKNGWIEVENKLDLGCKIVGHRLKTARSGVKNCWIEVEIIYRLWLKNA